MSVAIVNRERLVLREKQFSEITLMQQVKSENIGESRFVNPFGCLPLQNDRLILKLENEDSSESSHPSTRDGDSAVNDSFSLKIDSFSSHFAEETRQESFKEEMCESIIVSSLKSLRNSSYPQYLTNHTHCINIKHVDPFNFCLKGMQTPEFDFNSMISFPISEFPEDNPPYSKIVPTCQRFRDLTTLQANAKRTIKGNKGVCSNSATKFAKNDEFRLKNAKTIKRSFSKRAKRRKQFICKVCSAQYLYELAFVNHISKHTPKFQCENCAQSYTTQRSLSLHMRVHRKYTTNKNQPKQSNHKISKRIH